jgi:hypothetical protein
VLKKGVPDVRLEFAETASAYNDTSPQSDVIVRFETLRSGLFLRYGATDRLELGLDVPLL